MPRIFTSDGRWRRTLVVVCGIWLVGLLGPLSSPGLSLPLFFVTFWITAVLGAASLVLLLGRRPIGRGRVAVWLLYPLAAAALMLLFVSSQSPANPVFRLRFHLSRPALEAATVAVLARQAPTTPTWIGLFRVHRIEADMPQEIRYVSGGCGVLDRCGLAYVPGPLPAGRSKMRMKPLGGPWYHIYSAF